MENNIEVITVDLLKIYLERYDDPSKFVPDVIENLLATFFNLNRDWLVSTKIYIWNPAKDYFECRLLLPENQSLKDLINSTISAKNPLQDLQESCGFYLYCFNQKIQIPYLIEDVISWKSQNELGKYYVDLPGGIQSNIVSEVYLPVYLNFEENKNLYSIIVLSSSKRDKLFQADLNTLSKLLSSLLTMNVNKIIDISFNSLIKELSILNKVEDSNGVFSEIFKSLKQFYNIREVKQIPWPCRVKYGSYWSIAPANGDELVLIKEKRFVFGNRSEPTQNIITKDTTINGEKHFLYDTLQKIKGRAEDDSFPFYEIIKVSDIQNKLFSANEFLKSYEIEKNDYIIVFLVKPYQSKNEFTKKDNRGIFAIYVDQFTHLYFFNKDFIGLISNKLYENISNVIQILRKKARKEITVLIEKLTSEHNEYFSESSKVINKYLSSENSEIYLFSEPDLIIQKTSYRKNKEERQFTLKNFDYQGKKDNPLHSDIIEYLTKLQQNDRNGDGYILGSIVENNIDISILIFPIYFRSKVLGFIICSSKLCNINYPKRKESSLFTNFDRQVLQIIAEIIGDHLEILSKLKDYENLFSELPCTKSTGRL